MTTQSRTRAMALADELNLNSAWNQAPLLDNAKRVAKELELYDLLADNTGAWDDRELRNYVSESFGSQGDHKEA